MNSHLISEGSVFLNEEEVIHSRMATFHQRRAEQALAGATPLGKSTSGILMIHLFPSKCHKASQPSDIAKLVESLQSFFMFGSDQSQYSSIRPNVDGVLCKSSHDRESYLQCYRNLSLEACKSGILDTDHEMYLYEYRCEWTLYHFMKKYVKFAETMALECPITLFSSLIGCGDASYQPGRYSYSNDVKSVIGKPIATLPFVKINSVEDDLKAVLKEWNDYLSQALGMVKSHNYNEKGEWRART